MNQWKRAAFCSVFAFAALAQSDRGTITGTVTDPGGAVVPKAAVTAVQAETNAQYQTVTTATGDYTIPLLPSGTYRVTVEVAGFKKFIQSGIRAEVAQTARLNIRLEIGSASESVTVQADAEMLERNGAEQSTTIDKERLLAIPLYFGSGQGGGAIRNPLTFASLVPGAVYQPASNEGIRVNGFPTQSFKIILEGQERLRFRCGRPGAHPEALQWQRHDLLLLQL